jgi:hypothetical protein
MRFLHFSEKVRQVELDDWTCDTGTDFLVLTGYRSMGAGRLKAGKCGAVGIWQALRAV